MTARRLLLLAAFLLSTGWTIRDLGTLPGGRGSFANSISNTGIIVGAAENAAGEQRAVVFEPGPLVEIPAPFGFPGATANDVNDVGFIVGRANDRAFTYFVGGWLTTFDTGTGMYAVNESKDAAGFRRVSSSVSAAEVWLSATTPYSIGHLGTGASSTARDIEDFPVVVGFSDYDQSLPGVRHAFLWEDGTMIDLGTLGGSLSAADSVAVSVWPDPSYATMYVVGEAQTGAGDFHAFIWTAGSMTDLGTLPGHDYSRALAVNRSGMAVGISRNGITDQRAVMWAGSGIVDLNTLIDPAEGWFLTSANGINEVGQIVGGGLHHGVPRAYVLEP